jgi:hypothetical protein
MKADRQNITRGDFIGAAERVAAVLAATIWDRFHDELEPIKRPSTDSVWLDMLAARKYVRLGETKFRALRKEGAFPPGEKIGGKLMWDRRELDRCMERLFRKAKRLSGKPVASLPRGGNEVKVGSRPRKPR